MSKHTIIIEQNGLTEDEMALRLLCVFTVLFSIIYIICFVYNLIKGKSFLEIIKDSNDIDSGMCLLALLLGIFGFIWICVGTYHLMF
jgi:hypothetical protein